MGMMEPLRRPVLISELHILSEMPSVESNTPVRMNTKRSCQDEILGLLQVVDPLVGNLPIERSTHCVADLGPTAIEA